MTNRDEPPPAGPHPEAWPRTPAERLRWLEEMLIVFGPLVGLARDRPPRPELATQEQEPA